MKTIMKEYKIYSYDELSKEAQEKALKSWTRDVDYPFLQADLREYIHEELQDYGYKEESEITPLYDLSYSQGSGLMFTGKVSDKKGNVFTIKQSGHYYHERSTEITGEDKKGEYIDIEKFENNVYIPICQTVRDRGYQEIEYQESEEYFRETCEANEYTFLEDGTMFNE